MAKIRVLIVDDHTLFRESLRSLLKRNSSIEVVGDAEDGIEAVAKAVQLQPDVVLMDIAMPKMNGIATTRRVKRELPPVKILALTMHETEQYVREMLCAGVSGYISKRASARELIAAIQAAYQDDIFLHPSVTKGVVDGYLEQIKVEAKEGKRKRLTNRELEVLSLIAAGKTNKEIAELLNLSISTVQTHRLHLLKKLQVHDRTQLVRYAIREGLIEP